MHILPILSRMNELMTEDGDSDNYRRSSSYCRDDSLNRFVEDKNFFKLKLNIAGADKESIDISHDDNTLVVLARCDDGVDYHYRCHLSNERAEVKKTEAKYENGILNLIIPKHEKAKPLSIKVD